jgi:co-chaperonin GroES (HSP10)
VNDLPKKKFFIDPCGARLAVKEDAFKYEGRLVIPEVSKRRPTTGTVMAIGPDVPDGAFTIGDRVVYAQFSGVLLEFKQQPACRMLGCDEIQGKIPGNEELDLEKAL